MEIIWPAPIRTKLFSFHSKHFTPEETRRYIEADSENGRNTFERNGECKVPGSNR